MKKRKPKPRHANPVAYVLDSMRLLKDYNPSYWTDMVLRVDAALEALMMGRGTLTDFNFLKSAHHVSESILREVKGPLDIDGILLRSGVALINVHSRGGKFIMRADEMAAVKELLALHTELLEAVTVQQFERAVAKAKAALIERARHERMGTPA